MRSAAVIAAALIATAAAATRTAAETTVVRCGHGRLEVRFELDFGTRAATAPGRAGPSPGPRLAT